MKQLVKISCLFAVAAMAAVSCAKTEQDKTTFTHRVYIDVNEPVKTSIVESGSNASFIWSSDDASRFTIKENDVNGTAISLNSNDGYQTMTLAATFESEVTSSYTYTAFLSKNTTGNGAPKIPASQTSTGSSYDPDADILIAKPQTFNAAQSSLSMRFMRPLAINKMTLKGLDENEVVSSVTISADKNLTGYYSNDSWHGQASEIIISTDQTVPASGEVVVYFLTMPVEDATLTVAVTTGNYIYSKTFARAITFSNESVKAFGVSGLTRNDKSDYSGTYVLGNEDGTAMANAWANGNNLPQASSYLEGDVLYYDPDVVTIANASITLAKVTDTESAYCGMYTMVQNGKYLYAAGTGTSNTLKGEDSPSVNAYWDITEVSGEWTIVATKSSYHNILKYNSGNNIFSCYASGQSSVKLYADFAPTPVITASDINITADAVSSSTNTEATFNSNTATVSAAAYSDAECTSASDWLSVSVSNKVVYYTATANTDTANGRVAYIKIIATNSNSHSVNKVITVNQSKKGSSGPVYELVSAVADVVAGDYVITWDNTYYLPSGSTSGTNPAVGSGITVANNKLTNTVTSSMVWTFTGNNNDGFTISDGTNILHSTNTAQGISINTTSTRKWTVSVDGTYGMLLHGDDGGSRYLAVYNSGSWRYYSTGNSYTGKLRLYKRSSSAPAVAAPTFSVAEGTYNAAQSVTISCATSGASIYYTTDGSTPSSSSNAYSSAVSISQTTTLKAIAIKGSDVSDVASATYTLKVATPTFSPAGGSYTSTQNVSISCATTGATIYYTTDNSTPTTSSTPYTAAISVSSTTTIKAIAVKSNWENSALASGTFTISSGGSSGTDTWDLTIADYDSASTNEVVWSSSHASLSVTKNGGTNVNNYLGGSGSYTHTRFYNNNIMTFTPASGTTITSIVITCTGSSYTSFVAGTWSNATASTSGSVVTITPTDGTAVCSHTVSGTTRISSIAVNYN